MATIKLVRVGLVRDRRSETPKGERASISRPADVVPMLKDIASSDREHFAALHLDARNHINTMEVVSIGSLNASMVHPRELFKTAILANAAAIIVAHNHPSGDPTPSKEDVELTTRLKQAAEILGIEILDHLVVTPGGGYISMKEASMM